MKNNPYLPFAARIAEINNETDLEFTITVDAKADIVPGQFFQLSLPRIGEAPISVSAYSDDQIKFTIRAVGKLTSVLQHLKVGENLFIRGPYGHGFPVEKFANSRLVMVAGGSGVAPIKPLIDRFASGHWTASQFDLILGFKNSEAILFAEDIARWQQQLDLTLTIDKPEEGWSGNTGLVTEYIRKLSLPDMSELQVVVVGPPLMMKFAVAEFKLLGVPDDKIWVSFERLMSCGLGKCGHCKIDSTYVCVDGPVLNYSRAAGLID